MEIGNLDAQLSQVLGRGEGRSLKQGSKQILPLKEILLKNNMHISSRKRIIAMLQEWLEEIGISQKAILQL